MRRAAAALLQGPQRIDPRTAYMAAQLAQFKAIHGRLPGPTEEHAGLRLGAHLKRMARRAARGTLSAERRAALEAAVPGWLAAARAVSSEAA